MGSEMCIRDSLGELHRRGYPFHLYLVGEKSSEAMYRACLDAAAEYGVADYVHMTGNQPQSVCRQYARNALATLLPGEWNRVNIFYEVMGEGCVVLTNNNHSVDEFIDRDNNCLVSIRKRRPRSSSSRCSTTRSVHSASAPTHTGRRSSSF